MILTQRLTRRTVLKGFGAALALPWLEAMQPATTHAQNAPTVPNRLAVLYVPNGIHMPDWTPEATGSAYLLPWILQPLVPVQQELLVLTGLAAHKADGPSGNHARALAVFLTGQRPPASEEIRLGVSADQLAVRVAGRHTRLPSLELGCEPGAQAGRCDSPYSCAYTSNIAWKSPANPLPPEVNPRAVFERLFAGDNNKEVEQSRAQRTRSQQSILDFVRADAVELRARLGSTDRSKLDEYLTSLREVEIRIGRQEKKTPDSPDQLRPPRVPADYPELVRTQCDLLVLAFQADVTRVATCLFANEFSNRPYPFLKVPDGHHDLSHHGNDPGKLAKIRAINRFHISQLAYLLEKLKAIREGEGTLLDHCMIAYGSGNSDGNRHNHDNLPLLLAGRGCGTIKPGRHIRYKEGTPLMNLWLALLERMDAPTAALGDSTGCLSSLDE